MKFREVFFFSWLVLTPGLNSTVSAVESQDFVLENPTFAPRFESDSQDSAIFGGVNYSQQETENSIYRIAEGDSDRIILPTPSAPVLSNNLSSSQKLDISVNVGDNDNSVQVQVRLINQNNNNVTYFSPNGSETNGSSWSSYESWAYGGLVTLEGLDQDSYYKAQVRVRQEEFSVSNFSELSGQFTPKVLIGGVDPNTEEQPGSGPGTPRITTPGQSSTPGIGGVVESIIQSLNPKEVLANENVQDAVTAIATVLIPLTAIALASQLSTAGSVIIQLIINIMQRLISGILSVAQYFSFWSKKRVFGIVFDKKKKPIEGARVTLFKPDTRRIVDTQMTDKNGRYYFLTDDRSAYILQIRKEGYDLFEKVLRGRVNISVYLGQQLEYDEFELKRKKRVIHFLNILGKARIPLLIIGTLSWGLLYAVNQSSLIVILGLYYALAWLIELYVQRQPKPYGVVKDMQNNPLNTVVIRVFNFKDKLIATLISDDQGRFKTLLQPGNYRIRFSKSGYEMSELKNLHIGDRLSSLSLDVKLRPHSTPPITASP